MSDDESTWVPPGSVQPPESEPGSKKKKKKLKCVKEDYEFDPQSAPSFGQDPVPGEDPIYNYRTPTGGTGSRRFNQPKQISSFKPPPKYRYHEPAWVSNEHPDLRHEKLFKKKQKRRTWVIMLLWVVLVILIMVAIIGVLLAVVNWNNTDDNASSGQPNGDNTLHPTTATTPSQVTETAKVYEVSSEVTFEYYNDSPIEYDDALNDMNSAEYEWWQNTIIPVLERIFATLPFYRSVYINYMIPGSITVRFTCVFDAETDLTHGSLYTYFMTFVDENGGVSGSELGLQRPNTGESGRWDKWQTWGQCSVPCGTGQMYRSRTCAYGTCDGNSQEINTCVIIETCPTWMNWENWSDCAVSCGWGERVRVRSCSSGVISDCGGDDSNEQTEQCFLLACPTTTSQTGPSWNTWTRWSICSRACDVGRQYRSRTCNTGVNNDCSGTISAWEECNTHACEEGTWSTWQSWTSCSVTCDGGTRQRQRQCGTGDPRECPGDETMLEGCNLFACPQPPPAWSEWFDWTVCSKTCGGGITERQRVCLTGNNCDGNGLEIRDCNLLECEIGLVLGDWEAWGTCSKSCDRGVRLRQRYCNICNNGFNSENEDCNILDCDDSAWTQWTQCSVTCGDGEITRSRSCGSSTCSEVIECSYGTCVTVTQWNNWSPWNQCSVTCGGGIRQRARTCVGCEGVDLESSECNQQICVNEVNGILTFDTYNGEPIVVDESINDKTSATYVLWEGRFMSECELVYNNDPNFDRCIINDISRGSLVVSFSLVYTGDPPITMDDLVNQWRNSDNGALQVQQTAAPDTTISVQTTTTAAPATEAQRQTTAVAAQTTIHVVGTTLAAAPTTVAVQPTTPIVQTATDMVTITATDPVPTTIAAALTTASEAPTTASPIQTTEAPVPTTVVAVPTTAVTTSTSTAAPTTATAAPTTSTAAAPTTITSAHITTNAAHTTITTVPTTSTAAPTAITSAPIATTAAPTTTTATPTTTVAAPTTTTAAPATTVAAPTTTTAAPTTTTAAPTTTTATPPTTAAAPTTSTAAPTTTTAAPTTTTAAPTTTTAAPTTTSAAPTTTTTAPTIMPPKTLAASEASIQFTTATAFANEGGTLTVTLENSGTAIGTATIQTSDVTTTEGMDYTTQDNMEIQIFGTSTVNIDIPITADVDADCGEEFTVTISGPVGPRSTVTVTITEYMDISNDAFTASSEFSIAPVPFVSVTLDAHDANNLNLAMDPDGSNAFIQPAWAPAPDDTEPYLMVDLGAETSVYVYGVDVQGTDASALAGLDPAISNTCCFANTLKIKYGTEENSLEAARYIYPGGQSKEFPANTDATSVVAIDFDSPLSTRYLKFKLNAEVCLTSLCALRFRVKGCVGA